MLAFRPAISPRARVLRAELNGKPIAFKVEPSENDQHLLIQIPLREAKSTLRVTVANGFGISISSGTPELGKASEALRIVSESWSATKDRLDIEVSGAAGHSYELDVWNSGQITKVEGARLFSSGGSRLASLSITIPESSLEQYPHSHIVIQFRAK
jgi:hypothetical protein